MTDLSPWIHVFPGFLLLLIAIVFPGALLAWAMGYRRRIFLIAAPLLSVFLMGTGAIVAQRAVRPWGWGTYISWTLLWVVGAYVVRGAQQLIRRRRSANHARVSGSTACIRIPPPANIVAYSLGGMLAILVSAYGVIAPIGNPARPPQTWDAVFHLNALRWILDTGDASTLHLGAVATSDGTPVFYPAGWHDWAVLAVPGTAGDVVAAANVSALVIAALLWPFTATMLAATLSKRRTWIWAIGPIVASCFTAFPERLISYGTLWPTALSYVLVPLVTSIIVEMLRNHCSRRASLLVLMVMGLGAIGIAHPTGVIVAFVFVVWRFIGHLAALGKNRVRAGASWKILAWSMPFVLAGGLFGLTRTSFWRSTTGYERLKPFGEFQRELRGALIDAQLPDQIHGNQQGIILLGILTIGGILVCVGQKQGWVLPAWASIVALYLIAAVLWKPGLKLVGLWYTDPARIGSAIPLIAAPVSIVALATVIHVVHWHCARALGADDKRRSLRPLLLLTCFGVTIGLLYVPTGKYGRTVGAHQLYLNYMQLNQQGYSSLVSDAELTMMARIKEEIPPDAEVIGDPMNGSSLLYAVANVDVTFRHITGSYDPDLLDAAYNISDMLEDPEICRVLNAHDIQYYYTDSLTYWPEEADTRPLSVGLREGRFLTRHMRLVDRGGTAALWKITPCEEK